MRSLRKTTALLMTMLLVLTTVLSVMPVSVFAKTAAQTSVLPGASATVRATDGVSAVSTDNAITVTATAAGKAVITPDSASAKPFDMTMFNGLSMSVSSTAEFKLSLTFFSLNTFTSVTLSSADGDFNRVLPQLNAYIPAGNYSGAMDAASVLAAKNSAFNAKAQSSVYLRSVTVETDAAAEVTISALDVAEYSTETGTSLLTGTQATHAGTVGVTAVDNGYSLSTSDGYAAIRFTSTVKASLYANLHYNFTIENAVSNVEKSTFTVYVQDASGAERDFKLNSAITGNADADAAMTAGHYEGTVSMAKVKEAYQAYCAKAGVTEQDIVDDGMITITGFKVHLSITGGGTVDVYDISVSEPEAVAAPSLMPSAAQVAENGITVKDGWIVLSGNEGDTVSYTLDTYYNILTYDTIAANIISDTAYDIIITGEGAGTSSNNDHDTLGEIHTRNGLHLSSGDTAGDWWDTSIGVSTNNTIGVFTHGFYGSANWNGRVNANDMYHIKKVTIQLGGAGTVKVSALRMTTASDAGLSIDDITFTVGTAEGKAGDIVNVPVYLDSVSGVANFDMLVSFDKTLLTPVSNADRTCGVWNTDVTGSGAWKIAADQGNGTVKVVFASSKNSAIGGQLFYIPFKVNDNAGVVTTPVTVAATNVQAYGDINADSYGAVTPSVNTENGLVLIGCDDPAVTNISVSTTTATTTTTAAPANVMVSVVTDSEAVEADDVIAVDVMINGESGLSNFMLDVTFDAAQLTPVQQNGAWAVWNTDVLGDAVAAEGEEALNDAMTAANYNDGDNSVRLAFVTAKRNTANEGVLATVYFKVNTDIALNPIAEANVGVSAVEVQYYDAQLGYRTPAVTTAGDSVTVYPTLAIEFYDVDGNLIATESVINDGNEIDLTAFGVEIPKMLNYATIGWQITEASLGTMKVAPIYGYTVETVNGIITDASVQDGHWIKDGTMAYFNERHTDSETILGYNNSATIVANAASEGQKFSHWADQYDNIVSYEETYTIFVPGNLTLTAVFVDETVEIVKAPTVAMQVVRGVYNEAASTAAITWVADLNDEFDEETYTVTEAGIIYGVSGTNYDDLKNEFSGKTKKVAVERVSAISHQYSVTIAGVKNGNYRQAIAFATYTNNVTGDVVTVYSAPAAVLGMTAAADM